VSVEQRILNIAEEPISIWWYDRRELRAIALDARKLEDRVKQLEAAIRSTLEANRHLADGDNCTLIELKKALPDYP